MVVLGPETAADRAAVDELVEQCFGPGRYAKTAYRFREGVAPVASLSYVARYGSRLAGSLRFWPIAIEQHSALLLGPLAVDQSLRSKGIGVGLMILALAQAAREGHTFVMLVGDEPYYARAGFRKAPAGRFLFPGPVDPARLLIRELAPGALAAMSGRVLKHNTLPALAHPGAGEKAGDNDKRQAGRQQRTL